MNWRKLLGAPRETDLAALLQEAEDIISGRTAAKPRLDHLEALKHFGDRAMADDKSKVMKYTGMVMSRGIVIPASAIHANQVTEYAACASILKVISDAYNDYQAFSKGPKNAFAALAYFGNLAPDVVAIVTSIQALPQELGELDKDTLDALLADFSANMQLPSDHARAILDAVLKLAGDVRNNVADIMSLIDSIKVKQQPA